MPSTTHPAPPFCPDLSALTDSTLSASGGCLRAYKRGELTLADLSVWAARFPDEPPTVNGEYVWIGLRLADLD